MTLDELKQAAWRLRKTVPQITNPSGEALTHAQALDMVAQLHGYRHYHEAQKRLEGPALDLGALADSSVMQQARLLVADPGGIIPRSGDVTDWASLQWPEEGLMVVEGPSGCGKTLLVKELACLALAQGTLVRILDTDGSYRHFAYALGGKPFYDTTSEDFKKAWDSDEPLVVGQFDASAWTTSFSFEQLKGLPKNALFICEELSIWAYESLEVRTIRVFSRHRSAVKSALSFNYKDGSRGEWTLSDGSGGKPVSLEYRLSASRNNAFLRIG